MQNSIKRMVGMVLRNLPDTMINGHVPTSSAWAVLTSGNLTLEILALSGSSRSLPTQDWNSGRRDSSSSAGSMQYTNSKAFLERNEIKRSGTTLQRQHKQCVPKPSARLVQHMPCQSMAATLIFWIHVHLPPPYGAQDLDALQQTRTQVVLGCIGRQRIRSKA